MKKIILSLICCLFFTNIVTISANEIKSPKEIVWHDISEIESLNISETYSYDEFVELLSSNGYSKDYINEIKQFEGAKSATSTIRYSTFYMNTYTYKGVYKVQARFSVGLEYANSSSPIRIVTLGGAHLYTGGGTPCIFDGSIYYQLNSGNSFYYSFYGNLYTGGTSTISGGVSIHAGQYATTNFSLTYASGFLTNISESESYYSAGLSA